MVWSEPVTKTVSLLAMSLTVWVGIRYLGRAEAVYGKASFLPVYLSNDRIIKFGSDPRSPSLD